MTDLTQLPLDALLADVSRVHFENQTASPATFCDECGVAWPCHATELARRLRLETARAKAAELNEKYTYRRQQIAETALAAAAKDSERLDWLSDTCMSVSDGYEQDGSLSRNIGFSEWGRVQVLDCQLPTVPRETKDWVRAAIDRGITEGFVGPCGPPDPVEAATAGTETVPVALAASGEGR